MLLEKSKSHLNEFQESYLEHGIPAFLGGLHIVRIGLVLMIHAIVPALFPFYPSRAIMLLADRVKKRYESHEKLDKITQ